MGNIHYYSLCSPRVAESFPTVVVHGSGTDYRAVSAHDRKSQSRQVCNGSNRDHAELLISIARM